MLREVERRGALAGWTPHLIEGRDLPPVPEALEEALSGARDEERPLLLFDSYERLQAMGGYLRAGSFPPSPANDRRDRGPQAAGASWFEGGWESLVAAVELEPLSSAESRALLVARGLGGDAA